MGGFNNMQTWLEAILKIHRSVLPVSAERVCYFTLWLDKGGIHPQIFIWCQGTKWKEEQTNVLFGPIEPHHAYTTATTEQLPAAPLPLRRGRSKQICLLSLPCGAGWHASTSCFFTRWFVRLTHTTWFYTNNMLTIRGWTNPGKLFLKDDMCLYLVCGADLLAVRTYPRVVSRVCWQSEVALQHRRDNSVCKIFSSPEPRCYARIWVWFLSVWFLQGQVEPLIIAI